MDEDYIEIEIPFTILKHPDLLEGDYVRVKGVEQDESNGWIMNWSSFLVEDDSVSEYFAALRKKGYYVIIREDNMSWFFARRPQIKLISSVFKIPVVIFKP